MIKRQSKPTLLFYHSPFSTSSKNCTTYTVIRSIAVELTKLLENRVYESEMQSHSHLTTCLTFSKPAPFQCLFKKHIHQLCTTGSYLN